MVCCVVDQMLYRVLTAHAHSSARRPAGRKTTRKVSVDIRADSSPLILPREVVHAPRASDE
eukprot:4846678-Alexandrium_andersonii.AAC.1